MGPEMTAKSPAPLLPALACLAVMACAGGDTIEDRRTGQVLVCHNGKSIAVSNADMFVHQSHGDELGPCLQDDG